MYFSQRATHLTGFVFTVFLSYIYAFSEVDGENSLKLKIGFDLTQGTNGAPSLQIRNFEEMSRSRKLNGKNKKRSLRTESSSDSEEVSDKKRPEETKAVPESDLSDADSSGSGDDRRYSTRGLNPDDFEPEDNPKIHEKEQDSE